MLITELKPRETIEALAEGKKVFIINCHGCKEVYFPVKEAEDASESLGSPRKVTGILTTDYICNQENMSSVSRNIWMRSRLLTWSLYFPAA